MPRWTLLEMTNNILSAMDSDEVNNVTDTVESEQVAEVVKETYFAMLDEMNLPNAEELFQLEATSSSTPTKMKIPDTVHEVFWIKYNVDNTSGGTQAAYRDITYLSPKDFLDHIMLRNQTSSNVTKITDTVDLLVITDAMPTYWTSFDNEYVVFDSYHSTYDSNLQASKTQCHGLKEPTWTVSNDFVPDLPTNMFTLLIAESKSTSFFNFKQVSNGKSEQIARRQRVSSRKNKWRQNGGIQTINYGRKK